MVVRIVIAVVVVLAISIFAFVVDNPSRKNRKDEGSEQQSDLK